MNENNPPIPQPSGATCPHCGAAQPSGAAYCSNCGAPLRVAASSGSLSSASKIVLSIALAFGALVFGAVGGCFVLLSEGEGLTSAFALFIIVPALMALACIWGIFRVNRQ